jgi:hypothetical protein
MPLASVTLTASGVGSEEGGERADNEAHVVPLVPKQAEADKGGRECDDLGMGGV